MVIKSLCVSPGPAWHMTRSDDDIGIWLDWPFCDQLHTGQLVCSDYGNKLIARTSSPDSECDEGQGSHSLLPSAVLILHLLSLV